jgi:hypothetical protein
MVFINLLFPGNRALQVSQMCWSHQQVFHVAIANINVDTSKSVAYFQLKSTRRWQPHFPAYEDLMDNITSHLPKQMSATRCPSLTRYQSDVNHVTHFHVPPFSGTWSLTATFASLVWFKRLMVSSVSFWPFPGTRNYFFCAFNDIRRCELFCGVARLILVSPEEIGSVWFSQAEARRFCSWWRKSLCESMFNSMVDDNGVNCLN